MKARAELIKRALFIVYLCNIQEISSAAMVGVSITAVQGSRFTFSQRNMLARRIFSINGHYVDLISFYWPINTDSAMI